MSQLTLHCVDIYLMLVFRLLILMVDGYIGSETMVRLLYSDKRVIFNGKKMQKHLENPMKLLY